VHETAREHPLDFILPLFFLKSSIREHLAMDSCQAFVKSLPFLSRKEL
jgi:hypothetical protein